MKHLKSFLNFNSNFSGFNLNESEQKFPQNWKLNAGRYDTKGSVSREDLRSFVRNGKLTISFGKVEGDFDCSRLGLVSLEGCPQEVGGDFL